MRFRIDLKILIFFAVFYFTNQLNIYLWTMLFAFLHELGHLVIGLLLRMKPDKIEMTPFGFSLRFKTGEAKDNREKIKSNILIAIAGPITNLIIIFIILIFNISFLERDIAVYANIIIFAFNLIPIYPLDGGRVFKGILNLFFDEIKSEYFVNRISNYYMVILTMIGSITIYYFKNIAILLIIMYLWMLVIKENRRFLIKITTKKAIESFKKTKK